MDLLGVPLAAAKPTRVEDVPVPSVLDCPEFRAAWSDWLADRKVRKKPVTVRAAELQLADFRAWGREDAVLAIQNAIKGGWQGVFRPGPGRGNGGGNGANGSRPGRHCNRGEFEEHLELNVIPPEQIRREAQAYRARMAAEKEKKRSIYGSR